MKAQSTQIKFLLTWNLSKVLGVSFKHVYEMIQSFIKRQTCGTSSNNKWQRVKTSGTMSGTTRGNEWQRMTKRDNKWQTVTTNDNEWQSMTASGKTNDHEKQQVK